MENAMDNDPFLCSVFIDAEGQDQDADMAETDPAVLDELKELLGITDNAPTTENIKESQNDLLNIESVDYFKSDADEFQQIMLCLQARQEESRVVRMPDAILNFLENLCGSTERVEMNTTNIATATIMKEISEFFSARTTKMVFRQYSVDFYLVPDHFFTFGNSPTTEERGKFLEMVVKSGSKAVKFVQFTKRFDKWTEMLFNTLASNPEDRSIHIVNLKEFSADHIKAIRMIIQRGVNVDVEIKHARYLDLLSSLRFRHLFLQCTDVEKVFATFKCAAMNLIVSSSRLAYEKLKVRRLQPLTSVRYLRLAVAGDLNYKQWDDFFSKLSKIFPRAEVVAIVEMYPDENDADKISTMCTVLQHVPQRKCEILVQYQGERLKQDHRLLRAVSFVCTGLNCFQWNHPKNATYKSIKLTLEFIPPMLRKTNNA